MKSYIKFSRINSDLLIINEPAVIYKNERYKGKSFITLASYNNNEDYWLFKDWTVIGTTILRKQEWVEVLKHVNYTGDYFFTNAETLNLKRLTK